MTRLSYHKRRLRVEQPLASWHPGIVGSRFHPVPITCVVRGHQADLGLYAARNRLISGSSPTGTVKTA